MEDCSKERIVGVKMTYWIAGNSEAPTERVANFDARDISPARMGLPLGSTPYKPEAGDESYCGMHDQGPLPELREGGEIARLVGCVTKGKEFNNQLLTDAIEETKQLKLQQQQQQAQENNKLQPTKKAKTSD